MSAPGRASDGPPKASGASITGMAGWFPPYPHSPSTQQQQQPCMSLTAYSLDSRLRSLVSFLFWHVCSTISLDYNLTYIVLAQSPLCCVSHPLIWFTSAWTMLSYLALRLVMPIWYNARVCLIKLLGTALFFLCGFLLACVLLAPSCHRQQQQRHSQLCTHGA